MPAFSKPVGVRRGFRELRSKRRGLVSKVD